MASVSGMEATSDESIIPQVKSTKRPIKNRDQRTNKRKKQADQEDLLLEKALLCMERAGESTQRKDDDDDIFAQYIATEIRAIKDPQVKRMGKWKIQSIVFSAQAPQQEAYNSAPGMAWDYERPGYPFSCAQPRHNPTPSSAPSPHFQGFPLETD